MQIFLHLLDGSQKIVDLTQQTTLESLLLANDIQNCRLVHQGLILSQL
jgi:hypothetical protein